MSAFLVILLFDSILYGILGIHTNGFIIHLFSSFDEIETLGLPSLIYVAALIFFCVLFLMEYFLITSNKKSSFWFWKYILIFFMTGMGFNLWLFLQIEKVEAGILNIKDYRSVLKLSFIHDARYISKKTNPIVEKKESHTSGSKKLTYKEKNQPQFIFFIILEAWRRDFFSKQYTPHLYEFSQKSLLFNQHHSSSNSTRFGLFGLYYGLHPVLWWDYLAEERGPVLIRELIKQKYEPIVLSSMNLNRPEFNKTVFVDVPKENTYIYKNSTPDINDATSMENLKKQVNAALEKNQKYFFSVLLNSSHFPYYFPESEKTHPLNILSIRSSPLKERYIQSLQFEDRLLGDFLDFLESKNILKNSLLIITGDHGESLGENGHWGHSRSFLNEEVKTPLIIHLPNGEYKTINEKTIHTQIPTTVLEYFGVENHYRDYSIAHSLLSTETLPYLTMCDWYKCALLAHQKKLTFNYSSGLEGKYIFEMRDDMDRLLEANNETKSHFIKYYFEMIKDSDLFKAQ